MKKLSASSQVIKALLRDLKKRHGTLMRMPGEAFAFSVPSASVINIPRAPSDRLLRLQERAKNLKGKYFKPMKGFHTDWKPTNVLLHEFGHTLPGGSGWWIKKLKKETAANKNALEFIKKHEAPEKLFGSYKIYAKDLKPAFGVYLTRRPLSRLFSKPNWRKP